MDKAKRALTFALYIAALFMVLELIGGWLGNSLALLSDALHMLTDVGAMGLSLLVAHISTKRPTRVMTYGYIRAESLGALASGVALWPIAFFLIWEAVGRLHEPEHVKGMMVFIIATAGLIANLWMMKLLHPSSGENLNVKAAFLHVLVDMVGSIAVIVAGLLIWLTGWNILDPIITILFTGGILFSSIKLIRQSIAILMESVPPSVDGEAVENDLREIQGVTEVHDLHIWALSSQKAALSVHLVGTAKTILNDAHKILKEKHRIDHMTIQTEDPEHFEPSYCFDCGKGV